MFARLWWKEARQTLPVWAFLACVGLGLQGLIRFLVGPGPIDGYVTVAGIVTVIYLFLISATAFAGEREGGTLGLLDALPVDRLQLWGAKASFALATTIALGALLWSAALVFIGYVGYPSNLGPVTAAAVVWMLVALGWGLLWSAVLGNAMHSAVLAMASLGATLAGLVNLQENPTTEAAPALLGIALATAAASAFAFVRSGPPRWELRRGRPASRASGRPDAAELARAGVAAPRPWFWTSSVGRLAWETWRQIRADLRILLAVAVVAVALYHASVQTRAGSPEILLFAMAVLPVMTGVATFNGENRGRTHRFLDQHGVRPGVAWCVKVLMWWTITVVLWVIVQSPNLGLLSVGSRPRPIGAGPIPYDIAMILAAILGVLTIPYAVGALCGMVFRRAIMAGSIAVVVVIVLAAVIGTMASVGILEPAWPAYTCFAILGVSWAWSGDWLRFPPGGGKWARLALWCGVAVAVLVPSYIAGRAWNVPTLPADQSRRLFQTERLYAPAPPDDDAAPLYRAAERLVRDAGEPNPANGKLPQWPFDVRDPGYTKNAPPTDPGVLAWLDKVEPALAIMRKASRLTNLDYEDLRKATIFNFEEPYYAFLVTPLAVSAQARLGRGDLDGAWEEVETVLRMARQFSTVRGRFYFSIEPLAVGLALQWAADPRQTSGSLERALAAYRSLPPGYTPADRARLDRIAFQNTTELPVEDLIEQHLRGGFRRKVSTVEALQARVLTTPWELARARKVYDLLAASWIQLLGEGPYAELSPDPDPAGMGWRALQLESRRTLSIDRSGGSSSLLGPAELARLSASAPLVRLNEPGMYAERYPRIEAERRALALVLRLRIFQAHHDGVLPRSLAELPHPEEEDPYHDPEMRDPYAKGGFGYIASSGQSLLPLGDLLYQGSIPANDRSLMKPSDGCWLLYSVGPDLLDWQASSNLDNDQAGDLVYPLKDGVKPPSPDTP